MDPEETGGWTPTPPLKNHRSIGFLSNIGPDSMKNHIATKPVFNVGQSSARQLKGKKMCRFPLKNRKSIGFLSNTGPNSLKNPIATKSALNVGPLSACQ